LIIATWNAMNRLLETPVSRRILLKRALAGGAAALMLPWWAALPAQAGVPAEEVSGRLVVVNLHTNESLKVRYRNKDGRFNPQALSRLDHLFRCHYNNKEMPIDPALYVMMDRIHTRLGAGRRPLLLISGYRSPEYNRLLRARSSGVAKKSYHLKGMAADIRIKGIRLDRIREEALVLAQGGVGAYDQFIHVDLGPVRTW
jgi:uncharacterized protein YcbK (DUF882 family)